MADDPDNVVHNYIKRQRPAKLDLDLTLLQVLDGQRGGGSHVRSKEVNFLPQIPTSTRNQEASAADSLNSMSGIYLMRDEKIFQMRKAIRLR